MKNLNKIQITENLGAISASLYVAFQVIANMLSTKIAVLPGLNLAVDGGTIIYPLTFTLRDFVHKTLGKRASRQIVVLAGLVNLAMVLLFIAVGRMQPDPAWQYQWAYEKILLPVWRITLASIFAQIVSELVDTEIFSWAFRRFGDLPAVLFSNSIALVVDSFLFSYLAFFGNLPNQAVLQIVLANIIVKMAMSVVTSPSIKLIPRLAEFEKI